MRSLRGEVKPIVPDLSMCIVNWNTADLLLDLLGSIYASIVGLTYEVIVIDNASVDGGEERVVGQYPGVRFIRNEVNVGYAAGVNCALRLAQGRYLLILNPDVILLRGAVEQMVEFLELHEEAGAVAGICLDETGKPGPSYGYFPRVSTYVRELLLGRFAQRLPLTRPLAVVPSGGEAAPFEVEFLIGACFLVRREVLTTVGLMDERFFAFFEETDWCLRMSRYGWKRYVLPQVRVVHFGGGSFDQVPDEKIRRFYQSLYRYMGKHHGPLNSWLVHRLVIATNLRRVLVQHGGGRE